MSTLEQNILAKTRAEEFDADIWGKFYIPPYFNKLSLKNATKSSYIVGKRGCGKTMLLKYLDYHTAFSKKRDEIPNDEVSHIGIYWRVDTQFCNSLNHRGLEKDEWESIFESYFSLVISVEIIGSLRAIANSAFDKFSFEDFTALKFNSIKDFHPDYPTTPDELGDFLEKKRRSFSSWISNISTIDKPFLPPGKDFLDTMIYDIRKIKGLEDSSFFIYIDEVENLVPYQRHVLNSYLKHSQRPFIVSFTSKELSEDTATTGSEYITATDDFNYILLDSFLTEKEREVFFSEVFLANLDLADKKNDSPLLEALMNMHKLEERGEDAYKKQIISLIKSHFPTKEHKRFALEAVEKESIYNKLEDRVSKALANCSTELKADDFMRFKDNAPEALIILPALLNRHKANPNDLMKSLMDYTKNLSGPFDNWIHNNLFGALLESYRPYGLICPIYSGFDTFFTMSNDNLRHFLILCYKAREVADLAEENLNQIPPEIQARAAYDAAEKLIGEIKTFGAQGERLRMFVLRLGSIFRALQASPSMSEPEQNQFTINSGRALMPDEQTFLSEAKKHGVLTEQLGNKTKSTVGRDIIDYQLNPIYAPYFQISYRRKRKIELSVEELHILALGSEDQYKNLFSKIIKTQDSTPEQTGFW